MRQAVSLLLISILAFPLAPVSAQDMTPSPALADRLSNMNAEAEKFSNHKSGLAPIATEDASRVVSVGPFEEYTTDQDRDESDSDAIREKLLGVGKGQTLTATLKDGTKLQGRLGDVSESSFQLLLVTDEWRQLTFDEVATVWMEPFTLAAKPDESTWWTTRNTLLVLGGIVGGIFLASYLALKYKGN